MDKLKLFATMNGISLEYNAKADGKHRLDNVNNDIMRNNTLFSHTGENRLTHTEYFPPR